MVVIWWDGDAKIYKFFTREINPKPLGPMHNHFGGGAPALPRCMPFE
jgi:hypothetical protein